MEQLVNSTLLRRALPLHLSFFKMDIKLDSKYAIHEAAREGKSEYISSIPGTLVYILTDLQHQQ